MSDRIVRDELLTSERYWGCSPEARNLYLSVLLSADDCGRYTGSAFALRTKCMAGTVSAERIEKILLELIDCDLVRAYDVDAARYLFVPRFRQRLRYTTSRYPEPPKQINDLPPIRTDFGRSEDGPRSDFGQTRDGRSEVKRSEVKQKAPATPSLALPDWLPREAWEGFVEMRRKIKAPLTDRACVTLWNKLNAWRTEGHSVAPILDEATTHCWKSVWPPKEQPRSEPTRETI